MENKEYYTPNQEDLFVGYECQWLNGEQQWVDVILDKYGTSIDAKWFRTKFLCKQDIIDLGWEFIQTVESTKEEEPPHWSEFRKDKNTLTFHENGHVILYFSAFTLFNGICKSKNELKKLIKDYLNIPI